MVLPIIITKTLSGESQARQVTIYAQTIEESSEKTLRTIKGYTPKQNWATGPKTTKLIDLLSIVRSFEIRGYIATEDNVTTLNENLTATDTTITVASGTAISNILKVVSSSHPAYIQIGDELIKFTGISGNDLTGCTRGWGYTTASTHSTGDEIKIPAFCFKEYLRYIIEAGGVATLYYLGNPADDNRSVTYSVNFKKWSIREEATDDLIASSYNVIIQVVEGEDIG